MSQADVLGRTSVLLQAAGIPHMLSGSIASSAYGEPRSTQDIDLVIDPTLPQLTSFITSLRCEDYYVSQEAVEEAWTQRSIFNLIDLATSWKVDLILLKRRPYGAEEFRRRVNRDILGHEVPVVTPEDSILSKLEWRKDSQSERQYRDAVNVAATQWALLDVLYLRHWANELGVLDDLEQLFHDADKLRPK